MRFDSVQTESGTSGNMDHFQRYDRGLRATHTKIFSHELAHAVILSSIING